jgi:hypothetical protein
MGPAGGRRRLPRPRAGGHRGAAPRAVGATGSPPGDADARDASRAVPGGRRRRPAAAHRRLHDAVLDRHPARHARPRRRLPSAGLRLRPREGARRLQLDRRHVDAARRAVRSRDRHQPPAARDGGTHPPRPAVRVLDPGSPARVVGVGRRALRHGSRPRARARPARPDDHVRLPRGPVPRHEQPDEPLDLPRRAGRPRRRRGAPMRRVVREPRLGDRRRAGRRARRGAAAGVRAAARGGRRPAAAAARRAPAPLVPRHARRHARSRDAGGGALVARAAQRAHPSHGDSHRRSPAPARDAGVDGRVVP